MSCLNRMAGEKGSANLIAIEHSIKADHGYNLDSRSVRNLIEVMSSYTKEERRQFLQLYVQWYILPCRKGSEADHAASLALPSYLSAGSAVSLRPLRSCASRMKRLSGRTITCLQS